MDLERITHQGYKISVFVALGISISIVFLGAAIGRGTLNLRGALVLDEPTDITVIAAVEPLIDTKDAIINIKFLRKNTITNKKPTYDYLVETKKSGHHFIQLGWQIDEKKWILTQSDHLHESMPTEQEVETQP
jgi:frataxin-like iron-binding protein CyaY